MHQQIMLAQKISASGPPGGAYFDEVMVDSPVFYARLFETSGTSAANSGSTGTSGTYTGVTLGQTSLCGDAGDFAVEFASGGTRYVEFLLGSGVGKYANNFTMEAIIRPSTVSGTKAIMCLGGSGTAYLRMNGSKLNMLRSQIADLGQNTTSLVINTPYHVAVTVTGAGALTFYLNGVANGTGTTTTNFTTTGNGVYMGHEPASAADHFQGIYDEPAIYNTALSAARILAHAQAAGF